MAGIKISEFTKRIERLNNLYPRLPNIAATIAVQFSKDRFREQAWADARTEPWAKRKETAIQRRRNSGRAVLVKSGRLKRAPRKIRVSREYAVVGVTDVPYAAIHNNGFRGMVTAKSKNGTTFTRQMNVPRRRYLGESIILVRKIDRQYLVEFIRAIR
jgi:phage gpG-like protein